MNRTRNTAGRPRDKRHLRGTARLDLHLDVVAVQVQDCRLVGGPAKLDRVALLDAEAAQLLLHAASRDLQIEDRLVRQRRPDRPFEGKKRNYPREKDAAR
jgi:hypothetical protein